MPDAGFGVVELRRYRMHADKMDAFVALFDREFTENQEACGMVPIGHCRDRDDPGSFVWFRGFANMAARRRALEAFYIDSQTWKDHRSAANAAIVDSDDVLLLRNARPGSGFDLDGRARPAATHPAVPHFVGVAVLMLERPAAEPFISAFEAELLPRVHEHAQQVVYLVTDSSANDFPALPVRENEYAFVVAGVCRDEGALEKWATPFGAPLSERMQPEIRSRQILRLVPAARSVYGNDGVLSLAT